MKIPSYATLERVVHRRSIEQYNTDSSRILKTLCLYFQFLNNNILSFIRYVSFGCCYNFAPFSYYARSANISNTEFPRLASEDFNACQSIYQEELKLLERFVFSRIKDDP